MTEDTEAETTRRVSVTGPPSDDSNKIMAEFEMKRIPGTIAGSCGSFAFLYPSSNMCCITDLALLYRSMEAMTAQFYEHSGSTMRTMTVLFYENNDSTVL